MYAGIEVPRPALDDQSPKGCFDFAQDDITSMAEPF